MRARRAGVGGTGCNSRKSSEQQFRSHLCHWSWYVRPAYLATVLVRTPHVVHPFLFVPSELGKIDRPLRVLGPIAALCEMRPWCQERAMCERKAKKDASAAVVSRATPADPSRLAMSCWCMLLRHPSSAQTLRIAQFARLTCLDLPRLLGTKLQNDGHGNR